MTGFEKGRKTFLSFILVVLLTKALPATASGKNALIAGAASLRDVLPVIANAFEKKTGSKVRLTFGSSGNLAQQLRYGAPYELFLSANELYVTDLHNDGLTLDEGTIYAVGSLALVLPTESKIDNDGTLIKLAASVSNKDVTHFAIANPEHAPYGVSAKEALLNANIWSDILPHLVYGENVSQALQFIASGNVDGGIVSYAVATAYPRQEKIRYSIIPATAHSPINHRMVLTKKSSDIARDFYQFMQTDTATKILTDHGFNRVSSTQ